VFAESLLHACGKEIKVCRRQRTMTPFRLGLALTATCASHRVATWADFHRGFHALLDTTTPYKAFENQVAKPHCAAFMRTTASRLLGELTLKVLRVRQGTICAEFHLHRDQDGSSFAIHMLAVVLGIAQRA
jgi:hypothetical protein